MRIHIHVYSLQTLACMHEPCPHIRIRHITSPHSNQMCHVPIFESDMSCPHTRICHVTRTNELCHALSLSLTHTLSSAVPETT